MKAYWKYTAAAMAVVAALSLTGCGQQTQQPNSPSWSRPSRSQRKGGYDGWNLFGDRQRPLPE